jgi:hypothetical protein
LQYFTEVDFFYKVGAHRIVMQLLLEWTCGGNHCKKWNCFQNCRVDEGEQMWGGWHSMERFLKDQFTSAEEEMTQLERPNLVAGKILRQA